MSYHWYALIAIVTVAVILRLAPGRDHLLWNTNDYARDAYEARAIIANRDLRLIGPRAEVFSHRFNAYVVFAGPLYYYLIAPFYALSQGDPNLPLLANIFWHTATMVPLWLLAKDVLKSRTWALVTLLLFAVAYEQIEYARWLLNPAVATPLLAWFFWFLWQTWQGKRATFGMGLALGLAIQAEIFLGYWLVYSYAVLLFKKRSLVDWWWLHLGLGVGVLPLVISEFKFNFRMTQSLLFDLVLAGGKGSIDGSAIVVRYLTHLGVVIKHSLFGVPPLWSVGLFAVLLVSWLLWRWRSAQPHSASISWFLLLLLFAHAVVFKFNFGDAIYIDVGVGLAVLLIAVDWLRLISSKSAWLAALVVSLIVASQLQLLYLNTHRSTPFSGHFFLSSDTLLFKQRLAILDEVYLLVGQQPFTISVLDTPYGYPTLWASVFEQYQRRHTVQLPQWFGFYVRGVPGDAIFQTAATPAALHVVLTPTSVVVDPVVTQAFYMQQNQVSTITQTKELYQYKIELRQSK